MFLLLLAKFLQIISVEQNFLSSFMPTRISKVHVSWWLKQTRNFKDFLHTLYKSCFFRSWRETDPGNNFLWGQVISTFTPSSHWELFISARRQTTYQTDIMNNFFFAPTLYKRNSIFCRWNKSTRNFLLHFRSHRERFLVFRCSLTQSTCGKSNRWANLQTHSGLEGILSNYFSVQEAGFQVWTTLLLFNYCKHSLPTSFCEFWHVKPVSNHHTQVHVSIGPILLWGAYRLSYLFWNNRLPWIITFPRIIAPFWCEILLENKNF